MRARSSSCNQNYRKGDLAVINQSLEPVHKDPHHLSPVQDHRNHQKPSIEPQLLVPQNQILGCSRGTLKVATVQNRLVEDVRLEQKPRFARPQVLTVVELADSGGDFADFPALEPRFHEFLAILLLELPELGVCLEDLVEVVVLVAAAAVGGEVADAGELPVRGVDEGAEGVGDGDGVGVGVGVAHGAR